MAALLAAAAEPLPEFAFVTLTSEGVALIYGRDEQRDRGRQAAEGPSRRDGADQAAGRRRAAAGHRVPGGEGHDPHRPRAISAPSSSRSTIMPRRRRPRAARLTFGPPRDGAVSRCDIVLDLSGGAPLFPAADLRDGYLRADPGRSGRGAARRAQGARSRRHLRQAALHHLHRGSLRPFALADRRLPPLPRSLPDRRHRAGRRSRRDRCRRSAPAAANAPPPARPAPRPMRCRRPTR